MELTKLLALKDDTQLVDKYNVGFECTAKEARLVAIQEQILNSDPHAWAERFEVKQ